MTTRRGPKEGSIRHRPDGRWEARYRTADGRRRSLFATTRREVQERLRGALTRADHGIQPVGERMTTGEYLDLWLTTSVRPRLRASTADNYAIIVRVHLQPALGRVPLAKLTPEHVQAMLGKLATRQPALSPTTVRYVYAVLRIALGRALKTGRVLRNVATLVDAPPKARHDLAPLTGGEVRTLLDSTSEDRLAALYVAAVGLGMRQGELLGLRWSDVDLEGGLLSVRHSLQRRTHQLAEPKTERGRRTLAMPAIVVVALREHRRRQLADRLAAGPDWTDRDLVFTTTRGSALDTRNVTRALQTALARAGLPRVTFHSLRHACATLLIEQGEELTVVSRLLGHANLATTADVYAHLTRGMQQRAADRMDVILTRSAEAVGVSLGVKAQER